MQPEEIRAGRWVDVGPFKIFDNWTIFPAGGRDPRQVYDDPAAKMDFLIPNYRLTSTVTEGAELSAVARITTQPRYSGENVLLFELDSNLHLDSVKDEKGRSLAFHQAVERKEHSQSSGDYVAVTLAEPTQQGRSQAFDFQYAGKHVVHKHGGGNYFCQSFGRYPTLFLGGPGVADAAFRANFDITFHSPKKYKLVATGHKTSETTDGKELVTTWKSDIPLALPVSRSGITKYLQIGSATSKFRCMRIISRMNSCKVFSNTLRIQSTILPWGLEGGRILVRPCLRSAA